MSLSPSIAASSAATDLSLPTNSGTTMPGNTTMSRRGRRGNETLMSVQFHQIRALQGIWDGHPMAAMTGRDLLVERQAVSTIQRRHLAISKRETAAALRRRSG